MPRFGSQFNNTYFIPEGSDTPQEFHDYYDEGHLQGVLFHPATGTMSGEDPTYPKEKRRSDFSKVLKTDNKEIIHAAEKTDLPIAEMDPSIVGLPPKPNKFNGVNLNPRLTQYGGFYNPRGGRIEIAAGSSSKSTSLAHEWGHKEDWDISHPGNLEKRMYAKSQVYLSPISEGVADAYMERYAEPHSRQNRDETVNRRSGQALDYSRNVYRDKDLWTNTGELPGYSVGNKNWKNKQEMALYAASRMHVASGGKSAIESMPNMDELANTHLTDYGNELYDKEVAKNIKSGANKFAKSYEDNPAYHSAAKHLYLGKLVHENPALHGQLEKLGLGDVSTYSQAFYKHHVANTPLKMRAQTEAAMDVYDKREKTTPFNDPVTAKIYYDKDPYVRLSRNGPEVNAKTLSVQHTLPGMEEYDELAVNAAANPMPKPLTKKQLTRDDPVHLKRKKRLEETRSARKGRTIWVHDYKTGKFVPKTSYRSMD